MNDEWIEIGVSVVNIDSFHTFESRDDSIRDGDHHDFDDDFENPTGENG
jgi:hypothetical protein